MEAHAVFICVFQHCGRMTLALPQSRFLKSSKIIVVNFGVYLLYVWKNLDDQTGLFGLFVAVLY
jgi:hypothetical protein